MPKSTGKSVRSIHHTFTILEELYESDGARITELSERLDLSKSTIHSHLHTLGELGYVTSRDAEYHLGIRFLTFGGYVRDRDRLFSIVKEGADELADETGELVAVSTLSRGENVYIYQVQGERAMSLDSHLGSRLPLHCTATGKSILSALSDEEVDRILDQHGLPRITENTITDRDTFYEELEAIEERGVAFDDEERIEGMRGVGSAIVHGEREVVLGAIGITGPVTRMSGDRYETEIPEHLSKTARMVEINATYSE